MRANNFPDVCYFATYDFFKKVFKLTLPVVVDASVCVCVLMNSWLFWTRNFNTFSSMKPESVEAADCTREGAHFLMWIQKHRGREREKSIVTLRVFQFQWIKSFLYLHPSYLVVIRWSELKEAIGERAGCSCTVGCFQRQGATVFQTQHKHRSYFVGFRMQIWVVLPALFCSKPFVLWYRGTVHISAGDDDERSCHMKFCHWIVMMKWADPGLSS